ncbi:hypothetical protein CRUP_020537, partial [Coryphaenoides rupestris]
QGVGGARAGGAGQGQEGRGKARRQVTSATSVTEDRREDFLVTPADILHAPGEGPAVIRVPSMLWGLPRGGARRSAVFGVGDAGARVPWGTTAHREEEEEDEEVEPFMSPRYPGGPRPSLRMPNQPPGGIPGSQPLLPNSLDPTRPQGHPNMGGPMRMNPPRGMAMGPQNYGGMRPPPNSMGGPMPGMNMGPGGRGPWPGPNANSGPPGGGGPPGTPIMPSPGDSTNSSENIYTMMGPGGNRPNFPMGPGPDGPNGGHGSHGASPHERIARLRGHGRNSPNNMGGMNNPPGTPRDDGEMGGNFLNPFQSESEEQHGLDSATCTPQPPEQNPCKPSQWP